MPVVKRKEVVSSPVKNVKKAKKDPEVEKLQHQLKEVMAVVSQADISKELKKMVEVILPLSLGEFSDQRHSYQEKVVQGISGLLDEVESSLRSQVDKKRADRDNATADKPHRDTAATDASSKLESKTGEVQGLKNALAEKAVAFREARSQLAAAEEAKVLDGQKAREAEKKKGDLVLLGETLAFLKTTSPEDSEAQKKNKELMTMLRKHKFEESMMIALPAALGKAPDARGQFDLMAITQLDGEIAKITAEQDSILAAAAPGQEKCEAAIKAAQERLAATRAEQRDSAKSFDGASKEQAECETASANAQKAVRENATLIRKLERTLNDAEVDVELFDQGPKETLAALRQRATPPPPAESTAEPSAEAETTAEAAEMAVDESAPVAQDVEVPLVAAA